MVGQGGHPKIPFGLCDEIAPFDTLGFTEQRGSPRGFPGVRQEAERSSWGDLRFFPENINGMVCIFSGFKPYTN
jgi:hypothetical protein